MGLGLGLGSVRPGASARCCSLCVRSHRMPPSAVSSAGGTCLGLGLGVGVGLGAGLGLG